MTQLQKFRDSISNYFDELERGVGKRNSTFTDVDAVSHDKDTKRFLFREFKRDGEPLDQAQRWVLTDLAGLPGCTVWFVRVLDNNMLAWAQFGARKPAVVITEAEYRRLLHCWWYEQPIEPCAQGIAGDVTSEVVTPVQHLSIQQEYAPLRWDFAASPTKAHQRVKGR